MKYFSVLILLALLALFSCKKKDAGSPTGPNETPPENIIGRTFDQNGNPLANVQMHLVYNVSAIPTTSLDDSQNPTLAVFFTYQALATECNGSTPLADGTNIIIMWDADDDGAPSAGDRPPTVCTTPEECPFQTVNFNQFPLNGVASGLGAGTFYTDPAFATYGEHLDPSRYYLEIRCTDGHVLWRSQMVTLPDGLSDNELQFECLECEGSPVGETTLGLCYPNPALNNVTVPFTLRNDLTTSITAHSLSLNLNYPLLQDTLSQGTHEENLDISELPNGLYVYTLTAGTFSGHDTLLKNVSDVAGLRGTPALTTSDNNGDFALNASYGETITLREASSNPLGESLPLDSVRVYAIINGYLPADTIISLSDAEQHELTFRLQPE